MGKFWRKPKMLSPKKSDGTWGIVIDGLGGRKGRFAIASFTGAVHWISPPKWNAEAAVSELVNGIAECVTYPEALIFVEAWEAKYAEPE